MDKATPTYGPLNYARKSYIQKGDLVRLTTMPDDGVAEGLQLDRVYSVINPRHGLRYIQILDTPDFTQGSWDYDLFTFVGRPDQGGWITAPEGGYPENPVPGCEVHWQTGTTVTGHISASERVPWVYKGPECVLTRWRLLPEQPETAQQVDETVAEKADQSGGIDLSVLPEDLFERIMTVLSDLPDLTSSTKVCGLKVMKNNLLRIQYYPHPFNEPDVVRTVDETAEQRLTYRPKSSPPSRRSAAEKLTAGAVRCPYDVAAENVRNAHKALIDAIASARALDLRVIHNGAYADYEPSAPLILRTV